MREYNKLYRRNYLKDISEKEISRLYRSNVSSFVIPIACRDKLLKNFFLLYKLFSRIHPRI